MDGALTVSEGHRIAKAVESCLAEAVSELDRVIIHVDPADGGGKEGPLDREGVSPKKDPDGPTIR